jgi:hypothetical protein
VIKVWYLLWNGFPCLCSSKRNSYSTQWNLVNERPLTFNMTMKAISLFNAKGQTRQHAQLYRLITFYTVTTTFLSIYTMGVCFFWVRNDKCEMYNATYHHVLPHIVGKTQMQNRIGPLQNPLYFPLQNTLKQCFPNVFARGPLLAL